MSDFEMFVLFDTLQSLTRDNAHELTLARLHWELEQRKRWVDHAAVWQQLQPKVAQTVQQHVSYEFIWIHETRDYYLVECSLLCAL